MNISFKNLIFSFIVFLIIFSIILGIICTGIFDSKVLVARSRNDNSIDVSNILLHKAVVFKSLDGGNLNFFTLVILDKVNKTIYLTPIFDDYLTNYQNNSGATYISGAYSSMGNRAIIEIIRSFSGLDISVEDIIEISGNYESFRSDFMTLYLLDQSRFTEIFECDKSGVDFAVTELNVVLDEISVTGSTSNINRINVDKTVKKFKEIIK